MVTKSPEEDWILKYNAGLKTKQNIIDMYKLCRKKSSASVEKQLFR